MRRAAVLVLLAACASPSAPPPQPPPPELAPPPELPTPKPPTTPEPAPALSAEPDGAVSASALRLRHAAVDLGGEAPEGSGQAPQVAGPSVAMGPVVASVPISNAERVIAGLRAGFRRCYTAALQRDPNLSGAAGLDMKVSPAGEVTAVSVTGKKGLSPDLVKCLSEVARRVQFAPPQGGGSATIIVPFTMTR